MTRRIHSKPDEGATDSAMSPRAVGAILFALMAVLSIGAAVVFVRWAGLAGPLLTSGGPLAGAARAVATAYAAVGLGSLAWRLRLWRCYAPMPTVADADLPSVSVVMPAFNEGPLVAEAIRSVAASHYPAARFELIVIDDGSTDDTWRHIRAALDALPNHVRVQAVRRRCNLGKRHTLCEGFRLARGDVFVTMDSDGLAEPHALKNLVSPIVLDPRIDCVSGCIQALSPRRSLITRFLKCYYSLSFKFVRAYQNQFRGVFCAPGAASAYRASAVKPVLDEWSAQRFLGLPCATGEDRALTNLVLRRGGLTAYQQNAVVHCDVPVTYGGMVNMFLRWARSNIRETLVLWSFLWTRFRSCHLAAFRWNMFLALLSLLLPPLLVANAAVLMLLRDGFALHVLLGGLAFSAVNAAIYFANERDRDWVWLLAYHAFWVLGLSWIVPYAALTLRNTAWLTRSAAPSGRDVPAETQPAGMLVAG